MNLRTFEYLMALEQHQSFQRAADACGVSQPALSIQIKKLEEELGAQLLERGKQTLLFTPAGQEVLARARTILLQVRDIRKMAELWQDPYTGQLSLGAFPTLAPYYFPQITDHLVDAYPNLQFNLVEARTKELIQQLHDGTLDGAFLALPVEDESFEYASIFSEPFYLGVPRRHPLASRETVSAAELQQERLLLLEEGHCLRGQALDYCANAGIGEVLNFRASSMETLLQMIAMGCAMSFVPQCVAERNPHIHYLQVEETDVSRTIALFWRKSSVRRAIMLELVDDLSRSAAP